MKKILALFSATVLGLSLASCNKDDGTGSSKVRDYATQYAEDLADIETFLKTHSYHVVDNPGQPDDQDVTFADVPEGSPDAIWASPLLTYRMVNTYRTADKDFDYKVYYLKLREGGGAAGNRVSPVNTDAILAAYTGTYLYHYVSKDDAGVSIDSLKSKVFETNPYPQSNFKLPEVIRGWSEIFPQFKAGDAQLQDGSPTSYSDFGAGIMFIPSALGYYNIGSGTIPGYAPLIFNFKLYSVTRLDADGDGIPDYQEDLDHDGYMFVIVDADGNPTGARPDDIDNDGIPNYLDQDDDGDNVLTKEELRRPQVVNGDGSLDYTKYYYKFDGAAVDDPATPYDDRLGAPKCLAVDADGHPIPGSFEDYTDPARLRNYLDPTCTAVNKWTTPGGTTTRISR